MAITPQTATVIKALLALGLPRKAFHARVITDRISFTHSDGQRYRFTEWGQSVAILQTDEARATVAEHAQELADQNLSVTLYYAACGHLSSLVTVSSYWNAAKTVEHDHSFTAPCQACRGD